MEMVYAWRNRTCVYAEVKKRVLCLSNGESEVHSTEHLRSCIFCLLCTETDCSFVSGLLNCMCKQIGKYTNMQMCLGTHEDNWEGGVHYICRLYRGYLCRTCQPDHTRQALRKHILIFSGWNLIETFAATFGCRSKHYFPPVFPLSWLSVGVPHRPRCGGEEANDMRRVVSMSFFC